MPAQASLLSDLFPREKLGLALSTVSMGVKVGQGCALLIGAMITFYIAPSEVVHVPILGDMRGWQLIFLAVGVPGLLFIPLIFVIPEPVRRSTAAADDDDSSFAAYGRFVLRNRRFFFGHHFGLVLITAASAGVNAWTPTFLERIHGWSPSTAGAWLGAAYLAAPILGMPIHGAFADYLYRRGWKDIHVRYTMSCALLSLPFAIAAFLVPSPEMTAILIGLFLFILVNYTSLPLTAIMALSPSRLRGKAASVLLLVAGTGGAIVGPTTVGFLTTHVFEDRDMVGTSLIAAVSLLALGGAALFYSTLTPLRAMMTARSEAEGAPPTG